MRKHRRREAQRSKATARTTPQTATHSLQVQIEKPVYGGEFLARVEGKALFVPLALPGEQVRVRVVEEKRGYAKAEVEQIVSAAAERISPGCQHFGACGGCQYQQAEYAAQLAFKQAILRETFERGGICLPQEIPVLAGEAWAYRNRIRVAFDSEGYAGYRGRKSHALIRIAECPIAAPLLVRAALVVGEMARELPAGLRPTEVLFFCDGAEKDLLVTLLAAGSATRWFEEFAKGFAERVSETKGIELVVDGGRGGAQRTVALWGASSLLYRAGRFDYRVDQGAFFQVNRWMIDPLLDLVTDDLHGKVAWDLFAGVGLFARRLADRFDQVIAVETAAGARAALTQNLAGTGATAVTGATEDFLRGAGKRALPDLIVVDPPRVGLGAEATALLGQVGAPMLTYVSCDPATLARDLRALIAAGYTIDKTALVDLFPQTFHLETVVALRK